MTLILLKTKNLMAVALIKMRVKPYQSEPKKLLPTGIGG
jgi:hypothetical protein